MKKNTFRKNLVFVAIILLLGAGFLPSTSSDNIILASTTYIVDDDGGQDFTSIQDAIDAAFEGDIIEVWAGTYEKITVYKKLQIIGNGSSDTFINGSGTSSVVLITTVGGNISGFTISNGGEGIEVSHTSYYTISDNIVTGNSYNGIDLDYSDHITISDNTIKNNGWQGIWADYSDYISIFGNTIINNNGKGILQQFSSNSYIMWNHIEENKEEGIAMVHVTNDIITDNNIENNQGYGIHLWNTLDNNIQNNNFINNDDLRGQARFWDSDNEWKGNYWNRRRFLLYPIFGTITIGPYSILWIELDWSPAKTPYAIP